MSPLLSSMRKSLHRLFVCNIFLSSLITPAKILAGVRKVYKYVKVRGNRYVLKDNRVMKYNNKNKKIKKQRRKRRVQKKNVALASGSSAFGFSFCYVFLVLLSF